MLRIRASRRGATLPELMMVMILIMIVFSSVSALYYGSTKLYRRGEPANAAEREAAWAIERMASDIQQAISCTILNNEKTAIKLRIPSKQWDAAAQHHYNVITVDGTGAPYLVPGNWVYYYRGTAYGSGTVDGRYLWRAETDEGGTLLKRYSLSTGVVVNPVAAGESQPTPLFEYWPAPEIYRSVLVTVTVRKTLQHQVATSTMASELSLRNQ
jgi:type II secretory pathway pseudopilin PulG